jgi:hypothetical protein
MAWTQLPARLVVVVAERNGLSVEELSRSASKRAKYGNTRATNGHGTFDSKREAEVYLELAMRQAAGEIRDLVLHPVYALHGVRGVKIGKMTPDFSYWDLVADKLVVVDVKSKPTRTTAYRLRKRLFEAEYQITLTEMY